MPNLPISELRPKEDVHPRRLSPPGGEQRVHDAVRSLLEKMNITVVEPKHTKTNAICCGDSSVWHTSYGRSKAEDETTGFPDAPARTLWYTACPASRQCASAAGRRGIFLTCCSANRRMPSHSIRCIGIRHWMNTDRPIKRKKRDTQKGIPFLYAFFSQSQSHRIRVEVPFVCKITLYKVLHHRKLILFVFLHSGNGCRPLGRRLSL